MKRCPHCNGRLESELNDMARAIAVNVRPRTISEWVDQSYEAAQALFDAGYRLDETISLPAASPLHPNPEEPSQ